MTWTLPAILDADHHDDAVAHLRSYFDGTTHSGSFFEAIGGGGDGLEVANRITSDDIVALSMLSVPVSGDAARKLLEGERSQRVNALLAKVPATLSIETPKGRAALKPGSAAHKLWAEVRKVSGFGPVRTSKLLARKRPALIPIYDDLVRLEFGAESSIDQWVAWIGFFQDDELVARLRQLRTDSGIPETITLLRVLDVVAWKQQRSTGSPEGLAIEGSAELAEL